MRQKSVHLEREPHFVEEFLVDAALTVTIMRMTGNTNLMGWARGVGRRRECRQRRISWVWAWKQRLLEAYDIRHHCEARIAIEDDLFYKVPNEFLKRL